MLYTSDVAASHAADPLARKDFSLWNFRDSAKPFVRPARTPVLTRRYEIQYLAANGDIEAETRLAPALAPFEEAFSAFARGTLIATDQGAVAVEDLVPGMHVMTGDTHSEEVVWIGSMTMFPPRAVPDAEPTTLTRITVDAFGVGRPMPDLVLGPRARLMLRDNRCLAQTGCATVYAPARAFVDGVMIIEVSPVAPVTMYNIVLRRHGTIRAAGLEMESYHPGAGMADVLDPQMAQLFLALFPHLRSFAEFGPMAHPRLSRFEIEEMMSA